MSTYTISNDEIDIEKIYVGGASNFSNPAEIDFKEVVENTPERKEILRKKIESGTGKYWILLSKATDRARRILEDVSTEEKYDFVSQVGYLGSLKDPISAPNITILVLLKLKDSCK